MTNENKQQVLHGEAVIACYCFLNPDKQQRLLSTMEWIKPSGCIKMLSTRSNFFRYCIERDIWYGSDTTWLPYIEVK